MSSPWSEGPERPYLPDADTVDLGPVMEIKPGNATTSAAPPSATVSVQADFSSWKYEGYLDGDSSTIGSIQKLLDRLLWKYTSVLTAQPFEVAKVVLQVRSAEEAAADEITGAPGMSSSNYGEPIHEYADSDSDGEPAYFTPNAPPLASTPRRHNQLRRQRTASPRSPRSPRNQRAPVYQLVISNPDSILDAIAQHWNKEGARGTWKATNATFIYTILQSLIENWSRGVLAALFSVPDLVAEEDMLEAFTRTSHPMMALGVAAGAAIAAGLILAPLDLVRTKLLVTPTDRGNRGAISNLRSLPSYICPSLLVMPTILHSLVHPMLTVSLPLVLQSKFKMDWKLTPMTFSVAKFCAASAALFIKLPLETVLRRAQVAVLSTRAYLASSGERSLQTTVPAGAYRGVMGTIYHIVAEEGSRTSPSKRRVKGQGLAGLTRGWKVSFIGLVGLWTAGIMSNGGEDDVF